MDKGIKWKHLTYSLTPHLTLQVALLLFNLFGWLLKVKTIVPYIQSLLLPTPCPLTKHKSQSRFYLAFTRACFPKCHSNCVIVEPKCLPSFSLQNKTTRPFTAFHSAILLAQDNKVVIAHGLIYSPHHQCYTRLQALRHLHYILFTETPLRSASNIWSQTIHSDCNPAQTNYERFFF